MPSYIILQVNRLQDVRPSDADLQLALASLAPYIGDNSSHNRSALVAAVHQQRLSQARELLEAFKPPMELLDHLQKEVPFLSLHPPRPPHSLPRALSRTTAFRSTASTPPSLA